MSAEEHPKPGLYLDTSVPSAYYDNRTPERLQQTRSFWETLGGYRVCVSRLVENEAGNVTDPNRRAELLELIAPFEVLDESEASRALAEEYVAEGIFPTRHEMDARHAAIAAVARLEFIVSWNFKHLVRVQTRRAVNLLNVLKGYQPIEIVAPPEL